MQKQPTIVHILFGTWVLLVCGYIPIVSRAQVSSEELYVVGSSDSIIAHITADPRPGESFADFFTEHQCTFAGVPYGSGGKGSKAGQTLVNFDQMDCLTYVENMLALYLTRRMLASRRQLADSAQRVLLFARNLNYIRYDRGINCSWEDRHFYFTGAMGQLNGYGILEDVAACSGDPFAKQIDYVSTHPQKFPGIRDWQQVRRLEATLSSLQRYWYPAAELDRYIPHAQSGDIIAFATTLDGLDISHVGFVFVHGDGSLGINHSSSLAKALVCEQDLCGYLSARKTVNGFFVYRLRTPSSKR